MDIILKQATAATVTFPLFSTGTKVRRSVATMAAGDFKVLRHTAAAWNVANPTTAIPVEISTSGVYALPLTATELTPDDAQYPIVVACHDVAGAQWDDQEIVIRVANYDPYTLSSVAAASALAAAGTTITIYRGDSMSVTLSALGSLANISKLYFTVKARPEDADTAALIQIETAAGLLYINGAAGTAGHATITVNNAGTGAITITLTAAETAKLATHYTEAFYDVQIVRSAGTPVSTLTTGAFIIADDYTRATS